MKLSELHQHIAEDFVIDKTALGSESVRTSDLFIKYIKLYSDEDIKLKKLRNDLQSLIREKREYYSGNAPAEVYKQKPFNLKIKSDSGLQKYIDGDDDIIKANEQILIQEQKVELLRACMDEIKRRGFNIKTALEDYKFKHGEY